MLERRIPEWLRHAPAPGVRGFAVLAGFEAAARGILISVFPLAVYNALGDAQTVSQWYFLVGLLSLVIGLLVPWLNRIVPRRLLYSAGCLLFAGGALIATQGGMAVLLALAMITTATAALFVCFNAYVLDYIARVDLGRCETLRMFYSALGWTLGPVTGVTLMQWWAPAPFLIAAASALAMLVTFLILRMGNGKLITRARAPATNPLAYLGRFAAQPRLVAGFLFAVIRSCGWWVYVVYVPIFAVENGLGERVGGAMLSVSNSFLFLTPFMLSWMQNRSVRRSVRTGFAAAGLLFLVAWPLTGLPVLALAAMLAGTFFLILLDMSAGLPFLMSVKPSERTEMSAVYASYRDVSGILTPGAAWLLLLAMPVASIFAAGGAALLGAWMLAGTLHPRLGKGRLPRPEGAAPAPAE